MPICATASGPMTRPSASRPPRWRWRERAHAWDAWQRELIALSERNLRLGLRQSRIGVDVGVIPVGGWNATGRLILDFFGGTPGFVTGTVMGLPRLLYAFGRLEHGGTAVEVGQDHVLLAPRDPTSLAAYAFPQFFRSGNLYLRAPQVRVEQRFCIVQQHRIVAARLA